jgi:MFS family permease
VTDGRDAPAPEPTAAKPPPDLGWRPISRGARSVSAADFTSSPFRRLAVVHALSTAGDTILAVALSSSLFFSIDPSESRGRVALYLIVTVAPFAVVAPLIGPAIDRMAGGRRLMVIVTAIGRALLCALMVRNLDSLLLFPMAFGALVLGKGYQVSRSALVPSTVRSDDELVEANSKLGIIAGLVGLAAAGPALLVNWIGNASAVLALAAIVFVAATVAGFRLARTTVAATEVTADEKHELRSGGILLAASAMAFLRAVVGFLTFLVAFWFRSIDAATAWFGVAVALSALGAFAGSAAGPAVRRQVREEAMLLAVLVVTAVAGLTAIGFRGGVAGALVAAMAIGFAASFGRLAFDSIVQRDAPEANRGRAFAMFETRFQLAWVSAAFIPVVFRVPDWVGYVIIAALGGFAAASYFLGMRSLRERGVVPEPLRRKALRSLKKLRPEAPAAVASPVPPPPPQPALLPDPPTIELPPR